MKRLTRIIGSLGLLGMCALIAHEGAATIIALLAQAGWVLLCLVPLRLATLLPDVMGWRTLLASSAQAPRVRLPRLFGIAVIREAVNRLLPVANVGGEIIGIRLLMLCGIPGPFASASVIVELALALISQAAFVVLGILCLLRVTAAQHWVGAVLWSLGFAVPMIAGFVLLLRYGSIFERCARLIERVLSHDSQWRPLLARSGEIDARIRELYGSRGRLLLATGWQLASLIAGTLENYLVLRWLGSPVSFTNALALESVTQVVRNFVFVVPAGMGVQEAGLVALGALLGISGPTAIALSLAKRLREILLGLPALLAWHMIETRRAVVRDRGATVTDPQEPSIK